MHSWHLHKCGCYNISQFKFLVLLMENVYVASRGTVKRWCMEVKRCWDTEKLFSVRAKTWDKRVSFHGCCYLVSLFQPCHFLRIEDEDKYRMVFKMGFGFQPFQDKVNVGMLKLKWSHVWLGAETLVDRCECSRWDVTLWKLRSSWV